MLGANPSMSTAKPRLVSEESLRLLLAIHAIVQLSLIIWRIISWRACSEIGIISNFHRCQNNETLVEIAEISTLL